MKNFDMITVCDFEYELVDGGPPNVIGITFESHMIESNNHTGLLRLIGEKQDLS
jgi:hypothetical protein